jgi:gliding motility-associated-like protein
MDWKEYQETPEDGMFEAIQKRLRVRRAWRIGGGVAVLAVATIAALAVLTPKEDNAVVVEQEVAVLNEPEAIAADTQVALDAPATSVEKAEEQGREEQAVAPVPEPQMQVVAVAEPVEEKMLKASPLAVPAVAPRQTRVATEHPVAIQNNEVAEEADEQETVAKSEAKFGGIEPEPYHEDNLLWAPNIIVPSGDKEENRVFKVVASSELQDFRMHIYNRGGRLVYSTNDIHAAWDATVGGTMVPQGAYVWVATFRDSDGVSRRAAGTVTVVR